MIKVATFREYGHNVLLLLWSQHGGWVLHEEVLADVA